MTTKASIAKIAGLEERIADFAASCILICDLLPRGKAGSSNFKDQLARSATSVAANYAEASVPSSQRDFAGRLTIALKELAESRMHLGIISRLNYRKTLSKKIITDLVDEADAIAAIFRSALGAKRAKPESSAPRSSPSDANDTRLANIKTSIAELLKDSKAKPKRRPGKGKKKIHAAKKKTAPWQPKPPPSPPPPQPVFLALPSPPQRLLLPWRV